MASSAIDKSDRADDQAKRTVWVGNMAWKTKWQDLKDHMKPAGEVEFVKPLTYDGTDWGMSKGMALVRYATESEAANAIATLNDSELHDRKIAVDVFKTSEKSADGEGKKKKKGGKGKQWATMLAWMAKGMGKGKGKGGAKVGDWFCPGCNDRQFAGNDTCRKCKTAKPNESDVDAFYRGKTGDWTCPACGDHQFARNDKCRKCEAPKPDEGDAAIVTCRWCDMGECWDHGQIEKPAR